jgi:hypothetical protein
MLAGDPVEATEQAQKFLKERPLLEYYDEVLMGGLRLAQSDAERGSLDQDRMQRIRDAVFEIVDDLSSHEDKITALPAPDTEGPLAHITKVEVTEKSVPRLSGKWTGGVPVLCIPGFGLLDEAVAIMLAQLIQRQGIGAQPKEADAMSISKIFALDTKGAALVCLCYLENVTPAQIHYAIRRVRRKAPDTFILVSLLNGADQAEDLDDEKLPPETGLIKGSLEDTLRRILDLATRETSKQPDAEIISLPQRAGVEAASVSSG